MNNLDNRITIALRQQLNEYMDKVVDLDSLKNDKVDLHYVYQLAPQSNIESIFKFGASREFSATKGGNYYCTGLYTTFNLSSTIANSRDKTSLYGSTIMKWGVNSYDRYFICNKKIAQQVYGKKWRLADQIEYLFKDYPEGMQKIKSHHDYASIIDDSVYRSAANVVCFCEAMGGMCQRCDNDLNKYDIRGFIFHGAHDGDVALHRDFKNLIPLAYSTDGAKTWKTHLLSDTTLKMSAKDYDPIIFLGHDSMKYIKPENYRMINGFMRVQRKSDSKYNYISEKTKKILSPLWFANASPMDENKMALVTASEFSDENGSPIRFYVSTDGYYQNIDDNYPFMSFNEMAQELGIIK